MLDPEENSEENVNLADEVEMYLQSKSPPRSTNIFEWWKMNEPRYPNIATLSRSMLCTPQQQQNEFFLWLGSLFQNEEVA